MSILSRATGYKHWCIPHTEAVIEILGKESGAYECVASKDVEVFRPENLKVFDAVVLNNNCPTRGKRDLFHDVIIEKIGEEGKQYEDMPLEAREELAKLLYRSLVDYVAEGGVGARQSVSNRRRVTRPVKSAARSDGRRPEPNDPTFSSEIILSVIVET